MAHLVELDGHARLEALAFAHTLIGPPEQATLFDNGRAHLTVPVRLKGIRVERSWQFGDGYLALASWRGTGLAQLCQELLPAGKETKSIESFEDRAYGLILSSTSDEWLP